MPEFPAVPAMQMKAENAWKGRYDKDNGAFTLSRGGSGVTDGSASKPGDSGGGSSSPAVMVKNEQQVLNIIERGGAGTGGSPAGDSAGGRSSTTSGGGRTGSGKSRKRKSSGDTTAAASASASAAVPPAPPVSVVVCQDDYHYWRNAGYLPSAGKPMWITLDDLEKHHHIFFDDNIHNLPGDSIVAARSRAKQSDTFAPLGGEETLDLHGVHLVRVPTHAPILNERWFLEEIDKCESALARRRSSSDRESALLPPSAASSKRRKTSRSSSSSSVKSEKGGSGSSR